MCKPHRVTQCVPQLQQQQLQLDQEALQRRFSTMDSGKHTSTMQTLLLSAKLAVIQTQQNGQVFVVCFGLNLDKVGLI